MKQFKEGQIVKAFEGANFGTTEYRKLLEVSVLKKLVEYHCGWTVTCIMRDLKLIGKSGKVTKKGILFVREAYNGLMINQGG